MGSSALRSQAQSHQPGAALVAAVGHGLQTPSTGIARMVATLRREPGGDRDTAAGIDMSEATHATLHARGRQSRARGKEGPIRHQFSLTYDGARPLPTIG